MSDLALITGASKGIGRATALQLARENIEILATGRNVPDLESLKAQILDAGGTCHVLPAELNKDSGQEALITEIKNSGKKLKLLVHSAGVAKVGKVEEMKKTDWQDVIETNLSVPFYLTRKCLPLMGNGSQIIFINSGAGKQTFSEWAAYCASKHGLRALADVLRAEVGNRGIRVTTIYPASVDTPMQAGLPYGWDTSKMMQPEDVARAVINCFKQPANVTITDLELQNPAGIF
jgi:NADP-dependent 3-hydroxy acid dehydrogenase YdfG